MDETFLDSTNKRTRKKIHLDFSFFKKYGSEIIAFVIVFIGIIFVSTGIYNSITSDYSSMNVRSESDVKNDIDEIQKKIDDLTSERNDEYNKSAYSDKYNEYTAEIRSLISARNNYDAELYDIQSDTFGEMRNRANFSSYPFLAIGLVIILIDAFVYGKMLRNKKRVAGVKQ